MSELKSQALTALGSQISDRSRALSGAFFLGMGMGLMMRRRRRLHQFLNRNVLITGGSRGLGLALVREFAARGANVVFCARHPDEVARAEEQLKREGHDNVQGLVSDVSRPDDPADLVARVTTQVGPVDILINNAGTIGVLPFVDSQEPAFRDCLDLFLYGPLRLCREVLPAMMAKNSGGTIVNITSVGGVIPAPHLVPYNCGKAALVALSEGMSVELDRYGVNVLTVKPGLMRTGGHRNAMFGGHSSQEYAWFSRAAIHPALTVSAGGAARDIADAVAAGRRTLAIGWEAKLAPTLHNLFPEISHLLTSAVEKMMPGAGAQEGPLMGESLASEAPPLSAMMQRLEQKAIDKLQSARRAHAPV